MRPGFVLPGQRADLSCPFWSFFLDVEVHDLEGVLLNEGSAAVNGVSHQHGEELVGLSCVFDPHLKEARLSGFMVVAQSCSAFISPRPL